MQAGIEFEGEDPAPITHEQQLTIDVWNHLVHDNAIDWAGFALVAGMLGVQDPERLMRNLLTIKQHRPPVPGA